MQFLNAHLVPVIVATSILIFLVIGAIGMRVRTISIGLGLVVALGVLGWWGSTAKKTFTQFQEMKDSEVVDEFGDKTVKHELVDNFQPGLGDFCGPLAAAAVAGIVAPIVWQRVRKSRG